MASLEPYPVSPAHLRDELEPFDAELLLLIAGDDALPMEQNDDKKFVDDYMPLNPTSTPTTVDAFNPGFSNLEVADLLSMLLPAGTPPAPITPPACSTPTKKIGKRTKKCTYAARRREVAALRVQTTELEKQLSNLRRHQEEASSMHARAALEKAALAKSQAENARLRAIVSSQEAKIRKAEACMDGVSLER